MDIEVTKDPKFLPFRNSSCVARTVSFASILVNIRSIRMHWDQFKIIIGDAQNVPGACVLTKIAITKEQLEQFSLPGYKFLLHTPP